MRIRRIAIWILCSAVALTLTAGDPAARAAPIEPATATEVFAGSGAATNTNLAVPNCANLIAQVGGAVVGLMAQVGQLYQVCNANGWKSTQCLAQALVVTQSMVWVWWTMSQLYCQCATNPNELYCGAIGALPKPANPGGGGAMPPPGPPPPPPAPKPANEDMPRLNPNLDPAAR
ncbi:MAG: hypothetical protein E6J90_46690 [Deltaproteobacteria bacterium]|nr:MAG: hypothetical protein E6J90_46690 [Deltaproteobacteria bacterium]TMQ08968.1 MAG: hypothetical protein E6J91_31810 [Deltaproteobacteria bacterium]